MEITHPRYYFLVEKTVGLLLLAYPTIMLTIRGGMNGVFLLMLLLAVMVWFARPTGMGAMVWEREWKIYVASMFAMSSAILISQSYHQNYTWHPHDAASRYFLAIPVFILLRRMRPSVFKTIQIAFPVAAIVGLLLAKDEGGFLAGRLKLDTLDPIHFGDFEMALGMLSLFSINWFGRDKLALRILKIVGFGAGLAASFFSGSRGGWMAIPVFIAIFVHFKMIRIAPRIMISAAIALMLAITLLYSLNATFQQRVNQMASDVTTLGQGNLDTSAGIRWQLYKAATGVFVQHPIFGVGPEGFAQEMKPLQEAGKLTPVAAELGRSEVHNDILSKAAGMGVFGLAAILGIYFVPFWLFWQASKSASGQVKRAGILGIVFVSGFFIFGLTVEILDLTMAVAFYSFTVAVLLAVCNNIHDGEQTAVLQSE